MRVDAELREQLKQLKIVSEQTAEWIDIEMFNFFQRLSKHPLKELKPPADVTESERSALCKHKADSGRNYAEA
ncbi:hypothetical protein [Lysinibacillus sp. RC79]|uniref:hypothetical protein n=1 Tax=Lysinibacillus sp. RC79 TaxID=3156296 RepID=UPI00351818F7